MQNRLSPSVSSAETTDCEGGGGDAVTGLLGRLQRLKCRRRTTCVRALLASRCTVHCSPRGQSGYWARFWAMTIKAGSGCGEQ